MLPQQHARPAFSTLRQIYCSFLGPKQDKIRLIPVIFLVLSQGLGQKQSLDLRPLHSRDLLHDTIVAPIKAFAFHSKSFLLGGTAGCMQGSHNLPGSDQVQQGEQYAVLHASTITPLPRLVWIKNHFQTTIKGHRQIGLPRHPTG